GAFAIKRERASDPDQRLARNEDGRSLGVAHSKAVMNTHILPADAEGIRNAARLIRSGEVVGMPTETVYGLAGDALNPPALARIFAAKERPEFDPLIVHVDL